ncbi:MAG: hypothetical protein IJ011_03760 [Clostridia bacterium]|nr:hypothetical protein [Clostridia bacterium]
MGEKTTPKKDGKILIFILIGLLGLGLLLYGSIASSKKEDESAAASEPSLDPDAYAEKIEDEVERICKGVAGGCSVDAVVSLSGGYRAVYASDSQSSGTGYKNSMVLVGSGSSEGAVLVCYENPEISGIGIVLSCREDERVKRDVIALVSAAFSIGTNKIYVAFSPQS